MRKDDYSITRIPGKPVSGDPHDYYSEAPYWWPDPKNTNGPFIRRDGELYPNRFDKHREMLESLCEDVLYLTLAGHYLEKAEYLDRAVHLLKVFFLDSETKMNPHLEYAQAIFGVSRGRGIGIIDTKCLVGLIYCFDFLCEYREYADVINGLKKWFSAYITWLNTSKNGIAERDYFNNHSNWWNAQVASFAAFTGDDEMLEQCFRRFRDVTVPTQMGADGSFTDELTRTRSFGYCLFNLHALCVIAEIAHHKNIDLWHFETADHKGIQSGIEYMKPYVENPFLWKHVQIAGIAIPDQFSFQLGSIRLQKPEYQAINRERAKGFYLIRNGSAIGPLCLLEGFEPL